MSRTTGAVGPSQSFPYTAHTRDMGNDVALDRRGFADDLDDERLAVVWSHLDGDCR